jgi:hypothetical protein
VQPTATTGAGNLSCWCLMKSDRLADSLPIRELWATVGWVSDHSWHSSRCRARVRKWPAFTFPSDPLAPATSVKLALMKDIGFLQTAGEAKAKSVGVKNCSPHEQSDFMSLVRWLRMAGNITHLGPASANGCTAGLRPINLWRGGTEFC